MPGMSWELALGVSSPGCRCDLPPSLPACNGAAIPSQGDPNHPLAVRGGMGWCYHPLATSHSLGARAPFCPRSQVEAPLASIVFLYQSGCFQEALTTSPWL